MLTIPVRAAFLLGLMLAPPAWANESCPQLFGQGRMPTVTASKRAAGAIPLCFDAFAILYSPVSRTPVYAAERLTRSSVAAARNVDRTDAFHEEPRLPEEARSQLDDYLRSGYDRGHMAPAGDMPSGEAMAQSFTLANIVPQDRSANRGTWAAIEESVRRLATRRGEIFVVSGTIYAGASIASLDGRVLVPTQLFKAVFDPARGQAGAYVLTNDDDAAWEVVSMTALARISGIDVFPALSDQAKASAMALPEPSTARGGGRARRNEVSFETWLRRETHRLLGRIWRAFLRELARALS